ncbi:MAG: hypothetical protein K5770_14075 [Lachnospiraceae bacterium]|nr:hypothetical protein [Lachnospiraceae bacterium]
MEKSLEQRIFELQETIKVVISQSQLNVSIVALIMENLTSNIQLLAKQQLEQSLAKVNAEKAQKEEKENGDNTAV